MTRPQPQRLIHLSPAGSLLKRSVRSPIARKAASARDAGYLALVRQCPCLKCGMEPSEAAHIRFASAAFGKASGMGKKPDDRFAVPLCAGCHRLDRHAQHARDEQGFWYEIGINPLLAAARLYAQRGDLVAMRAVVFTIIAERGLT